jgi:para-aminobenzoate synthetase component 1
MSIDFTKLQMDELLSRLDDNEHNISVLGAATANGWTPTIAWNPVNTFKIRHNQITDATSDTESFINNEQTAGRLCIGYLSYDFGRIAHNVNATTDDDIQTPVALIYSFDNWITFDDLVSKVHGSDEFNEHIKHIMNRKPRTNPSEIYSKRLSPAWSRDAYNAAYVRVHDYIKAGDIYQVNLTHRLEGTASASGIDIYRRVSNVSNANFQSYIAGPDFEIISASPERFVRISNGLIETSPVKGTRPRGKNPVDDEALRADLETNPKDHAELDMITDLMRNDLGVVSDIGTVHVVDERVLTAYPTLWHAHSTIQGTLRTDISPIAALASLMPGGSITGTPKKRAIEIIDELEQHRRGLYTGSIFVVQPNGDLDSNIAIRTMIKKSERVYLSVGGGIVYDSAQSDEYEESMQKAAVFTNL